MSEKYPRLTKMETIDASIKYSSLKDAIENLTEIYNKLPEDQRDSAEMDIGYTTGYYDSVDVHVNVTYHRPETDEEYSIRLEQLRIRDENNLVRERELLVEMAKKHGMKLIAKD